MHLVVRCELYRCPLGLGRKGECEWPVLSTLTVLTHSLGNS